MEKKVHNEYNDDQHTSASSIFKQRQECLET